MAELITNNAFTTLAEDIDGSTNPITFEVTNATTFPSTGNFRILINNEIMLVTTVSGNDFTASRAQEGTPMASHVESTPVEHILTKQSLKKYIEENCWRPYPTWDLGSYDDEFNDPAMTGWTLVESGTPIDYEVKSSKLSIYNAGDGSAQMHAFMRACTLSPGDYIECCFSQAGDNQNYNNAGLVIADGMTAGAGRQILMFASPSEGRAMISDASNYVAAGTAYVTTTNGLIRAPYYFFRLQFVSTNVYKMFMSPDGIKWVQLRNDTFSGTSFTPTHIGFWCTTWISNLPHVFSFEYFRKGP